MRDKNILFYTLGRVVVVCSIFFTFSSQGWAQRTPFKIVSVDFHYQNKKYEQQVVFDITRADRPGELRSLFMNGELIKILGESTKVAEFSPMPGDYNRYQYRLEMSYPGGNNFFHRFLCDADPSVNHFRMQCTQIEPEVDGEGRGLRQMLLNVSFRLECSNESPGLDMAYTRCVYTLAGEAKGFRVVLVGIGEERIAKDYFLQNIYYVSHMDIMRNSPESAASDVNALVLVLGWENFKRYLEDQFNAAKESRRSDSDGIQLRLSRDELARYSRE